MQRVRSRHHNAIQSLDLQQLLVVFCGVNETKRIFNQLELIRAQPTNRRHLNIITSRENGHVVRRRPPTGADESDLYRSVRFHEFDPFDDIDRELIHVNIRLLQNRALAPIVSEFNNSTASETESQSFKMEIWLVRHGDTIVAEDGLYQPHHGLTDLGFQQAQSVAEALANIDFDACYSSALPRAVQTAQVFATLTSREFTQIDCLNEIEVGRIEEASPEFKQDVVNHRVALDFSQFGGENPSQFSSRIQRGFELLLRDAETNDARRIVGFLHGGTIGAILDHMQKREFDYRSRPRMPNCAYTVVSKTADGGWTEWQGWHTDHLAVLT